MDQPAHDQTTRQRYQQRHDEWAGRARALTGRWNALGNGRLVAFALGVVLLVWGIAALAPLLVYLAIAAFVAFVVLVWQHRALRAVRERSLALAAINAEGVARVSRDWAKLPRRDDRLPDADHPYDADLDITGPSSLLHLIDTTTSAGGQARLRGWLLAPASVTTIRERQAAVAELAPRLDDRQELARHGRLARPAPPPDRFLRWAEDEPWLTDHPWLPWIARVLAVGFVLGVIAQATGLVPLPLWLPILIVNLLVSTLAAGPAPDIIAQVHSQHGALQRYGGQLGEITSWETQSPLLVGIRQRLTASGGTAATALRRLDRILSWSIPRGSLVYFPAQAAVLWDVHVLAALEGWQRRNGQHARDWLDTLFETEALAALGGVSGDNPSWAMPDVDPRHDRLAADALGHPLIRDDERVPNPVTVGPAGTFLLVTGSNMSGKSTMLRAIGVNAVLANAGTVVCAQWLTMPPLDLWTSVRVTDSLSKGVSFFMAELLRLKSVVDAAHDHAVAPGERRFLYLLDEILQGTNSRERRIAAQGIIEQLVRDNAIGAVTTHDLDLANQPDLARAAVPVHFREHVADGPNGAEMRFDHLMRPGIATSTNALRLMEAIGLSLPVRSLPRQAGQDDQPGEDRPSPDGRQSVQSETVAARRRHTN